MMNRRLQIAALAAVSAAAAFSPATASAQLGRLKKAAADAAKDAAGVKTEPAKDASSNAFVITPERLSAVIAVMESGMARAEKESAAKAFEADYNTKKKAWESCAETQLKAVSGRAPAMDGVQKSAELGLQTSEVSQRMAAAQSSQNYQSYVALADTMQILSMRSALVMYGADAKCGPGVYMPAALVDASAQKMSRSASGQSSSGSGETIVPPNQRAGMTTQQFGMVRERMALWVLQQTNNAPVGNNKYGIFTAEEQSALDAQGAKIKKWAQVFKDAPRTWSTWGDIKSW